MENVVNVKKRETKKELEIDGRTFVIYKFDPLLGNYVALQVLSLTLPFGISDKINDAVGMKVGNSSNKMMGKQEFLDLQRDILSVCFEKLPAGETPVVRENGTYGISDFTASIALQLLIGSIAFNLTDFFGVLPSTSNLTSEESNSNFVSM